MNKIDFMECVKCILEETNNEDLQTRGKELKEIIESMVTMEISYYHSGLR